ncbi:RNA-directed DNA polymerase, eukaryota [Tanacetum coccineum]
MGVLHKLELIPRNFFNGTKKSDRGLSLISWNKILASKKIGGLGESSYFALNRALLVKWVWRLISLAPSLWSQCIDLLSHMKKKVGNGDNTSFWNDIWIAEVPLKLLYPRLYALELDRHSSAAVKLRDRSLIMSFRRTPRGGIEEEQLQLLRDSTSTILLPSINDRWTWMLESSGDYSVKSARSFIDDLLLPTVGVPTRWVNIVPIKINIFAWRVCLDKLPTRLNLSLRRIDIPSIICPNCSITVESTSHLLFSCHLARQIMLKVARWWDLEVNDFHSYGDWLIWFNNLRLPKRLKEVLEGVFYVMWWTIWKFRNMVLFGRSQPRMDLLFDDIVLLSYTWCSSRCVRESCGAPGCGKLCHCSTPCSDSLTKWPPLIKSTLALLEVLHTLIKSLSLEPLGEVSIGSRHQRWSSTAED